jgi:tetratricopeptide (TPR) repeat protein
MSDLRARLSKILDLYGQALAESVGQHEPNSQEAKLPAKDLILRFAGADPTNGKARTQWLIKTYILDDKFKLEDLGRVDAALSAFERFKRKLPVEQRELSLFKSLRELEALIDPFVKAETTARLERDLSSTMGREKRRLEELKARDESIIIQEAKGLPTIAVPMTEFASCWWGRGTKWCTAAEKDNAFARYHKAAPLVVIVCPDGAKFQIHVEKDDIQFMDNTDNTVDKKTIQKRWDEFQSLIYWALHQNGYALQYIPEEKITLELYQMAIELNGEALHFVPKDKRTFDLCYIAVKQNGQALEYVPEDQRTPELCRLAIEQYGQALGYIPKEHRTLELCRVAIQQDGQALYDVPTKFKKSDFCYLAVQQDGCALEYVPEDLKNLELYRIAVEQNGRALYAVPEDQRTPKLCCIAVEQNGLALAHIFNELRTPAICRIAVEQNGLALQYISKDKRTPKLCRLAVEQNERALVHVPEKYRTPELLALIPPSQPKWHPDILQGLDPSAKTEHQDNTELSNSVC